VGLYQNLEQSIARIDREVAHWLAWISTEHN